MFQKLTLIQDQELLALYWPSTTLVVISNSITHVFIMPSSPPCMPYHWDRTIFHINDDILVHPQAFLTNYYAKGSEDLFSF